MHSPQYRCLQLDLARVLKNYTAVDVSDRWLIRFEFSQCPQIKTEHLYNYGIMVIEYGCDGLNPHKPWFLEITVDQFINWCIRAFRQDVVRNLLISKEDFPRPANPRIPHYGKPLNRYYYGKSV